MTDLDLARQRLGKEDLVLAVHDGSFPSEAADDIGRGTPYGRGARGLYAFARELGFTGVQLGPQGVTSRINPSPYDGTLFSKSPLAIALEELTEPDRETGCAPLLPPNALAELVQQARSRAGGDRDDVAYELAFDNHARALEQAFATFQRSGSPALRQAEVEFIDASRGWLEGDAAHEPEAQRPVYRFAQFLVHRQHARLRRTLGALGLSLYGDWQIGIGWRDALTYGALFVPHYAMGAPPSRTNPDGQPWSYAVLDPSWADARETDDTVGGAGRRFVLARLRKSLGEYDALRIDHPHGWIDPWVYDRREPDPDHAVRVGARLHAAPDLPEHPELARYAIARPDEIDRSETRYGDDWVMRLDEEQVDRYARGFDVIMQGTQQRVVCEILSTQPYPLARVMQRYGLGRFRVTQKSDVLLPDDVYRSDQAEPADWIMMGNHDTSPMWTVVPSWTPAKREARARYFAERLGIAPAGREGWIRQLVAEPEAMVHAELADILASRAAHVSIFFADLFGQTEIYNRPGIVDPRNWRLRVPGAYRTHYAAARQQHRALDFPFAFALALHARGLVTGEHEELFTRLAAAAARPLPPLAWSGTTPLER
jgi:4-alpha-glucanotransferase